MSRKDAFTLISAVFLAPFLKVVETVALAPVKRPDLLLVLAASTGWSTGISAAIPAGFVIGAFDDVLCGRALGSRALSLAVAAVLSSFVKNLVNQDSWLAKMVTVAGSAVMSDFVGFGILRATGVALSFPYFLRSILPLGAIWTPILVIPMGFILSRLTRAFSGLWPASSEYEGGRRLDE